MLHASPRTTLLMLCMLATLCGCGGGGSDSPPAAPNRPPVLTTTTLAATEDTPLEGQLAATDADNHSLTFVGNNDAQHGQVTVSASGSFAYTPSANYSGTDTFSVRVTDTAGSATTGTITIDVAAVNDAPVLTTSQFSVVEEGSLTVQLASTDVENQAVEFQVGTGADNGQVSISPTGLLTYTPDPDFSGADTLMVGLTDDGATLTLRPLTITVTPVNDPPVAFEDLLRVPASAVAIIPVLANDRDVDGEVLAITILSQPGGGTLAVNATNQLTFTRDNSFNGPIRFSYRITDAEGVTAEAEARVVIGEFPGIYFLSDETTVGQPEVHWFDGLRIYRLGTDLDPGDTIRSFSMADDGQSVAYVVESAAVARVFFTGPNASDSRLVYTSGATPPGSSNQPFIKLNRDGTYLLVIDAFAAGGPANYMVRTSDGLRTRVGGNTPQVVAIWDLVFNPVNDDFYVQAQVGGVTTTSGTGYLTLLRGNSVSAGTLTQVGAVYPAPSGGAGSGMELAITADGRYALHREVVFSPSYQSSVLVYDSVTNLEAPVYKRPDPGEIGMWNGFSLSNDGARVCFLFREPDGGGSSGPSRFIAGSPGAPASAAPVTPVFASGYQCRFGSDNQTVFYVASTAAEPREQIYAVNASAPGTPVVANRPFVAGEQLANWWIARAAPRLAFGTRNTSMQTDFYSISLDAPGAFMPFATNVFDDGSLPGQLDRDGFILAYSKRPAPLSGLRRLTLLSTQSANYSFSLTRDNTSTGMLQFQWAP